MYLLFFKDLDQGSTIYGIFSSYEKALELVPEQDKPFVNKYCDTWQIKELFLDKNMLDELN